MHETVRMAIARPSTRRAGLMLSVVLLAILAAVAVVGTLSPSALAGLLEVVRSHSELGYGWWAWWW